ncbi:hypothetical protein M9H77_13832 [Catharanthus roseus]|uniref:Uncharacterized protein n=1 Tax=Catharanthus roseus TaxID=4058 RepID=A0ACC0BLK6_CATRO|nr:hypothetical protein M9H77_13832 [Catharanthus roseus]
MAGQAAFLFVKTWKKPHFDRRYSSRLCRYVRKLQRNALLTQDKQGVAPGLGSHFLGTYNLVPRGTQIPYSAAVDLVAGSLTVENYCRLTDMEGNMMDEFSMEGNMMDEFSIKKDDEESLENTVDDGNSHKDGTVGHASLDAEEDALSMVARSLTFSSPLKGTFSLLLITLGLFVLSFTSWTKFYALEDHSKSFGIRDTFKVTIPKDEIRDIRRDVTNFSNQQREVSPHGSLNATTPRSNGPFNYSRTTEFHQPPYFDEELQTSPYGGRRGGFGGRGMPRHFEEVPRPQARHGEPLYDDQEHVPFVANRGRDQGDQILD